MRTLVHVSDLHFGRVDPALLGPLARAVVAAQPDVVAVSGDLTQRARKAQFREARAFLDRLPMPQVVVPGNHDVPLYDMPRRFLSPLTRFRRYIEPDLAPFFRDDQIAVLGLNTARALTFKHGRVNAAQVALVQARFAELDASIVRIVVTHHPFELPPGTDASERVGRAAMAMRGFAACGVDLLLSGHLHRSHAGSTVRYTIDGHAALAVQAGTASSTRGRGESNAFNVLRIEHERITVDAWRWRPRQQEFVMEGSDVFRRGAEGWVVSA